MVMVVLLFSSGKVFETSQFSTYFEGYGLYEDADFTLLRVVKLKFIPEHSGTLTPLPRCIGSPE
jgi:hypothetical protein